jgi:autonomous glycyl radical cofactor GrcA
MDVSLVSREGSIINRTEFTTVTSANGRTTSTSVGAASTILSHNSLSMDAGKDLDLQGSQFKAAQDITLKAGNDILLGAIELASSRDTSTRKVTTKTSSVEHQVVSIEAGHQLTLDAGRDLNAEGTQFKAGVDASLKAGRDLNLNALANTTHSESIASRKKVIDTETTHTLVDIQSGGNVSLKAGQDANLTGTNINAQGNVSLAAARDVNLTAVVDSDYHYDYTKKKKSFGRSKTTENETLDQTVTGGVINAGGNILVNAVEQQNGNIALLDSRNVNIAGAVLTAGGDALIGAMGDVTLTAVAEDSIDYHRKSKSGLGGLTGKSKTETHLRTNQIGSLVSAEGDAVVMAGKDVNLAASTVYAGQSAELHAGLIDDNGDINITSLQNLSFDETKTRKKSFGFDISKDFVSFSKETRAGNDKTLVTNAGSQVLASDNITGNASRDINLQGSLLDAGNNVNLDAGRNINLLAGTDSYTEGQEHSTRRDGVGWGGDDNGFSVFAGNETRKNREQTGENLAAATQVNAGNNVNLTAEQDILIAGSDVNAGKSITLDAKRDVVITTSTDTLTAEERNSFTRDGLTLTANHNIGQAVDAIKDLGGGDNAVSDASGVMRAADAMNQVGPSGSAFLGQTTTTDIHKSDNNNARGSNLNAGEDVTITAGNNATVAGSQVNAQRNISIDANDINLIAAENTHSNTTKTEYQQVGVTLQATQGNASLTAGFSKADSKLVEKDITTSGTGLNAGQDVTLIARNDINIVGSDVNAKRDITLDAGNDVNITSGQGYTTSQFESDYQSAGAGINFGTNGIGFTAYVALGENELDRENINNRNSHLNAGQNLNITSGNDTNIKGGNLQGQDVTLDVGNNLTIASVQDTGSVKGKQWDISGSITVGAGVSGGASVGYGETEGSSAWVAEQTSVIGSNSVTIKTKNHTQIDGALVANIKEDGTDGGNLSLDTNTLGFSDLKDHHEETSTYLAVGFSTGGNPGANSNTGASPDSKDGSYSFDAQYNDLDRKQTTRATIGNGTVTVREDQATGNNSTAGLNRNIDDAQEITKDKSTNIDVYYSSTAMDSLKGLATTDNPNTPEDEGQQNTLNVWKDNVTSVASPDAWKVVGENGVQSLQDTGTAVSVVKNKDNLGAGDFWKTLDNTVKGTQIKNDLLRDPANRHILEGLQSKDGDEYAAAMVELGHLAQAKFGVSLSDIMLYDAGKTTSSSLTDTLLTDVRGGMVLEGSQQGSIYVDAGDGKTKTDMTNTLGHEVYENQTFQNNGVNDNKQEDLANAFGEHFSNRINQASGGTLNSTGGSDFNDSLQNSNAIKYGTARANQVGNNAVDHRQLASAEVQAIRENASAFANRQGYRNSDGSLDTARAERELTQAFLSEADAAWDKSYQEQGVVINQNATAFIDQLREQYADEPFVNGGKAFVVNEGDREDRLKYAGTLSTEDGFTFYHNNAATDAGKNLLGQKEGININPEFNSGLSQGYKDQDIVTGQERAAFWENPVSNSLALLGSGLNQLIFPADGMKTSLDKDMKADALHRLEVLEGDAYGAGYVYGRDLSESNDSANQAIFGVLAAGRVLLSGADKTPDSGTKNIDDLPTQNGSTVQVNAQNAAVKNSPEYNALNNPAPSTTYQLDNGTTFRTNSGGYVEEITFTPVDNKIPRDSRQTAVGKEGLETDVGGHIQACSMGGTCDRFNLFPQDKNFNNSGYKAFENEMRNALKNGDDVGSVTVKFQRTDPNSARPDALRVEYTINGETRTRRFINQHGGGE